MDNKEKRKNYRELNEDKIKQYNKDYYIKNREKILFYQKEIVKRVLSDDEKERMKNYSKEYRKNNPNKVKESRDKWKNKNPNHENEYNKEKRLSDSLFKLKRNIRTSLVNGIKNAGFIKKSKTIEILGCSFEEFKQHLESKFENWMNWDNYGNPKDGILEIDKTWDIDHIIPTSSATTEEELLRLNHFTNLQPLCSYHNRLIKRNIL